jgi:translation initiation factor 2 subunit 1
MEEKYPDKGELVVANVERVVGYGAFVRLEEYGDKQGMVSIKEFSQKWVKNPRDYLREGQKAVLKVLGVNPERGHIDLSLKTVNDNERRNKLKDFKLSIRIDKLLDFISEKSGKKKEELYNVFGDKLIVDFGSLYDAFAQVANEKEDLKKYITDEKLREIVLKAIKDSITPTLVSIKGFVSIHSDSGEGLEDLKSAIISGEKTFPEDIEGKISYVAPPNYRIDISADDYKTAEKAMKDCYDSIEKYASSKGMETEFLKTIKKQAS